MNSNEIIEKLKLNFENAPEEIPINFLINGNLAKKTNFIQQLMLADNTGYTEEEIYKYIFWCGTNKILEDLASNDEHNNSQP
jgi:hypothetical protein